MNEERKGMVNQIMADSEELIQAERRKGGILSEQSALEILKIEAIRELINAVEGVYFVDLYERKGRKQFFSFIHRYVKINFIV